MVTSLKCLLIFLLKLTNRTCVFFGGHMNYRVPTIIMLVTLAFGLVVMASSFPPAQAASQIQPDILLELQGQVLVDKGLSQANQIKMLIGAVGFLFFGYMWWVQRYITGNDKRHAAHSLRAETSEVKANKTAEKLQEIIGEHRMSMQVRGCGGDASILRTVIEEALAPMNLYVHQRTNDPKDTLTVTERTPTPPHCKQVQG